MDLIDDFSFSEINLDNQSLDLDEGILISSSRKGFEYLSNVDYSLNSPLIADEIEEFLKYTQGRNFRKSWNINIWKKRRQAASELRYSFAETITPTLFHKWFGRKNYQHRADIQSIHGLINKTQKDSDDTFPVVHTFLKGWLGSDVKNPTKNKLPHGILKWGALFLDLHIITLLLNALDDTERISLSGIKNVKFLSKDDTNSMTFGSDNFGKVLISYGFAFFLNERVIMDRNTLLMCKDTYIARFQTLISMVNRSDNKYAPDDWTIVNKIYLMGDKLLQKEGNKTYDAIKMIEPICNLHLADLARRYRPLIPEFPSFCQHIRQSLAELRALGLAIDDITAQIRHLENPDLVLMVFGSFRHWGHPYIQYIDGLQNVHDQVNMEKDIDESYSKSLASDLAFLVLKQKFQETKRWYIETANLPKEHPFKEHATTHTWPTPKQIEDFGDHWHELPLIACFDIPDVIDPSIIYSDKSHSLNRSQVLSHVNSNPDAPIPSKKVLQTFLNRPATNWKEFLQRINDHGLTLESLIIGLKAKEREVKIKGRFFSLMSWELREYFVVTEHLIKTFFVPLFKGLTMADDLNTVIKKLMDNSNGQGLSGYENICIANHIDYTKWNNHQRDEANKPVFTVMGQFLGYPNLIARTHEFFQKSLIYYNNRPDLMKVENQQLVNRTHQTVTWNGQLGGLEGLRQKGWSVVNLLVIRRESINQNTRVKILAQGDNQVICMQYQLQKARNDDELNQSLKRIHENNAKIMAAIERGTQKLGLIINQDETLQSADFLIYGKVPIFRGTLRGIESKRWSRVTCVTNDQLPTLANTMSTINSNALTIAHSSTSPINAMVHYNFIGNFALNVLNIHNPALKSSPHKSLTKPELLDCKEFKITALYLDPCLGGACGMSLTRFLIRSFPDPVTESLSFWKLIGNNGPAWLRELAVKVGNPRIARSSLQSFKRLMEDPLSLNIPGGANPLTLIKEEVKSSLIARSSEVKNDIIRTSLEYIGSQEDRLVNYLRSIQPLFPRFLSEYLSGTYIGIIRGLVGLFQNSKTIRTIFSRRISSKIKKVIIDSEVMTFSFLMGFGKSKFVGNIWKCSSERADRLRLQSWGSRVFGATVPHPLELIITYQVIGMNCNGCQESPPLSYYLSTLVPQGLSHYNQCRGPYKAYLGSKTSESTSILQPWEKDTKVPLIRRAAKLRTAIGWFIEKDSPLSNSILQNLHALTGEEWGSQIEGFKRTGSALHRFSCARQSSAGYAAQSPSKLTWMCSTTDTLSTLNTINYDFMHQSLLIFAQATVSELMDMIPEQGYFHSHIRCINCLREIEEITLNSDINFEHKDVYQLLERWKPTTTEWANLRKTCVLREGNWEEISHQEQSYHIGRAEGFMFGDLLLSSNYRAEDSSLFPLSIQNKVYPDNYLEGILNGLLRASSLHCISRRSVSELKRPKEALLGMGLHLIDKVSQHPAMITLWRSPNFENLFFQTPHTIPASYPLSNYDLGHLGKTYLRSLFKRTYIANESGLQKNRLLWIFSDINETSIIGLLNVSSILIKTLYPGKLNSDVKEKIRGYKDIVISFKDPKSPVSKAVYESRNVVRIDSEIRHACRTIRFTPDQSESVSFNWGQESVGEIWILTVRYHTQVQQFSNEGILPIHRIQNPLISGMRLFQMSTGCHYKIRSILVQRGIQFADAIVGGDGSGGITSALLRLNTRCRVIFNSLLKLDKVDLRGTTPSPPSAVYSLGAMRTRCVNLMNSWEYPNDLREPATWTSFLDLKKMFNLFIDLIIIDAEIERSDDYRAVESMIIHFIHKLLDKSGTLIYKTYLNRILNVTDPFLKNLGHSFKSVEVVTTEYTSSQSSEVYLICMGRYNDNLSLAVDFPDLLSQIHIIPSQKKCEHEFKRALNLKSKSSLEGIPSSFLPDACTEFSSILESLGVETGVAYLLMNVVSQGLADKRQEVIHLLIVVSYNSLIRITALTKKYPLPPSDNKVYHLGILTIALLNWVALCNNDFELHKTAQNYITNSFPCSWLIQKVVIMVQTSGIRKDLYRRTFSITGKYKNTKNFHLDSKMSKIGAVQRGLIRVFGYEHITMQEVKIDQGLNEFNEKLTLILFKERFDLYDILSGMTSTNPRTIDIPGWLPDHHMDQDESAFVS